jgi:hypothetical protein
MWNYHSTLLTGELTRQRIQREVERVRLAQIAVTDKKVPLLARFGTGLISLGSILQARYSTNDSGRPAPQILSNVR